MTTITATDLADRPERVVVDVRTPAEFETAHIPGAINVPLDLLRAHTHELTGSLPVDPVLVCRSGARARQAAERLSGRPDGAGAPQVLDGGMQAWSAAGLPVQEGRARWDLERQVRLVAGSIVLTSIAVSTLLPRAKWPAGGIGAGPTFAAVSDTCAMGMALSKLPYNRGAQTPTLCAAQRALTARAAGA